MVHRLDARVKLLLLLAFVISLTLIRSPSLLQLTGSLVYLIAIVWLAELPVLVLLRMSLFVLPFVSFFSVFVYFSGDTARAWFILAKSYLSALSVVVCTSSTPLPQLVAAGRYFRIPDLLLEVIELTYRYLFVLSGQAQAMQTAFRSRAGRAGSRALQAASGMIAVLFSRSYEKAGRVHQAMLGRGFAGTLARPSLRSFGTIDIEMLAVGLLITVALHFM